MFDALEAINDIIDDINTEHYNDICDELELRVESGDLTIEDAQLVADYASDIFIEKKNKDEEDDEEKEAKKAKRKKIIKRAAIGAGAAAAGAGAAALGYKHVKRKKAATAAADEKGRVKRANLKYATHQKVMQDRWDSLSDEYNKQQEKIREAERDKMFPNRKKKG